MCPTICACVQRIIYLVRHVSIAYAVAFVPCPSVSCELRQNGRTYRAVSQCTVKLQEFMSITD